MTPLRLATWLMTEVFGNHLWQSVLVLAVAALLTPAFRNNRAQVRYWIWFAASAKFLIPFSLLMLVGNRIGMRAAAPVSSPSVAFAIDMVSQPFSQSATSLRAAAVAEPPITSAIPFILCAIWMCGFLAVLGVWCVRWRRICRMVRSMSPRERRRELAILRDVERALGRKAPIVLNVVQTTVAPGVYGIFRPVLLWPQRLSRRLADGQIAAIFAHELSHVRRRDNLAAAMHMVVTAIFWFHPLVWWLGARLTDERERACDEEVIRLDNDPVVYAEAILQTCRFHVEHTLPCVVGVTGSQDLNRRLAHIVLGGPQRTLPPWKKALLGVAAATAAATPLAVGMVNAPAARAQTATPDIQIPRLEVVSVKSNTSSGTFVAMQVQPGGRITITNAPVRLMIRTAYGLQDSHIVGGPDWIKFDRFDVMARAEGNPTQPQLQLLLRTILAQRFNLMVHNETRELPVYALTLARSDKRLGPKLRPSALDCSAVRNGPPPSSSLPAVLARECGFRGLPGTVTARGVSLGALAASLSGNPAVNRIVLDRTGLTGDFDIDLTFTPDQMPAGPMRDPNGAELPPIDPNGPSVFTALQEQLGLKLELRKAPVEVLVIDRAEHPTPD
jgi:bla regulator protein blaR1